jgi:hypothetical protein
MGRNMKIKFETAYRKLDLEKDEFELLGDFIRIFREEFADDHELDQYDLNQ